MSEKEYAGLDIGFHIAEIIAELINKKVHFYKEERTVQGASPDDNYFFAIEINLTPK